MSDQPKPPLWRVVITAWCLPPESWVNQEGCRAANVIRALADWLVPEEPAPIPACHAFGTDLHAQAFARWRQRQELRQLLLAEADRAEVGE